MNILKYKDIRNTLNKIGIISLEEIIEKIKNHDNFLLEKYLNQRKDIVNVSLRDDDNMGRPLSVSITKNNIDAIKILLKEKNLEINYQYQGYKTPLIYAIKASRVEIVKLLLQDERTDVNYSDQNKTTPLIQIFQKSNTQYWKEMTELLLEKECDISLKDRFGKTSMDYAKQVSQDKEYTEILLKFKLLQKDDISNKNLKNSGIF